MEKNHWMEHKELKCREALQRTDLKHVSVTSDIQIPNHDHLMRGSACRWVWSDSSACRYDRKSPAKHSNAKHKKMQVTTVPCKNAAGRLSASSGSLIRGHRRL